MGDGWLLLQHGVLHSLLAGLELVPLVKTVTRRFVRNVEFAFAGFSMESGPLEEPLLFGRASVSAEDSTLAPLASHEPLRRPVPLTPGAQPPHSRPSSLLLHGGHALSSELRL